MGLDAKLIVAYKKETAGILPNILYQISDGEGAVLIIGGMEEKE